MRIDVSQIERSILNLVRNTIHAVAGVPDAAISLVVDEAEMPEPVGEGTGLGLSAVHGVIAGHGGHVGVVSAPGHGSTFSVCLPCAG